jgi:hypothetical protein
MQHQPSTSVEIEAKLQKWLQDSEAVMSLFPDDHDFMSTSNVPAAQNQLRVLKEELEWEYHRMETVKGQEGLSDVAKLFYWPAVQDAWANSGISAVKFNSRPNHKWFDALYQVRFSMGYWIDGLKRSERD